MNKVKLSLDSDFRDTLNSNFEELNATKNINGKVFKTLDDRLRAIEYGMQQSGFPIDGDPDQE